MTKSFRNTFRSILINLMLLTLVASFALWGIGDIFRGGFGKNYVAKIGETTIDPNEYRQELNFRLANFRQLLGSEYSTEMMNRLGIPQQVLQQLIRGKLITMESAALGIAVPEKEILTQIRENTAFQSDATFNKEVFLNVMRQSGLTEERYMEALEQETAAQLLTNTFDPSALVSNQAVGLLYKARNELRDATLYTVWPVEEDTIKTPNTEELAKYFETNKEEFRTPEYRSIRYIHIPAAQVMESAEVSDAELRNVYEERKNEYLKPEQREVSQLLYETREAAVAAQAQLQQGVSIADVAKKTAPANKELSLGLVTRNELPKKTQDAVFSLQKGNHSNPIESSFGWHIFKVTDIKPESIPPFEEMRAGLNTDLLEAKREEKIYDLTIKIEDMLASGASIEELADERGTKIKETVAIGMNGSLIPGAKENDLPPINDLITKIFSGTLNEMAEFDSGTDGDFYVISAGKTVDSTVPELDTVKTEVLAAYKRYQAGFETHQLADKLLKALKEKDEATLKSLRYSQKPVMKIEHPVKAIISQNNPNATKDSFPDGLRDDLFSLKIGDYTFAAQQADGSYVIAQAEKIHPAIIAKGDKAIVAEIDNIRQELETQYHEEITEQYLQHLQKKYPVDINEPMLQSLLQ